MEKKVFRLTFGIVFTLVVGYSTHSLQYNAGMSDLSLANVEALANGEESGETAYCWTQFTGGLAWPRQCPSCIRLPFATGLGTTGTCTVN